MYACVCIWRHFAWVGEMGVGEMGVGEMALTPSQGACTLHNRYLKSALFEVLWGSDLFLLAEVGMACKSSPLSASEVWAQNHQTEQIARQIVSAQVYRPTQALLGNSPKRNNTTNNIDRHAVSQARWLAHRACLSFSCPANRQLLNSQLGWICILQE